MQPSGTEAISKAKAKRILNLFGKHISKGQVRYFMAGHLLQDALKMFGLLHYNN